MSSQDQQIMFVFPGQGSQYVGMGSDLRRDFPVAQRLYEQANDIVGYDLVKLCLEGPEEALRLTRHTQPALLVHSLACLEIFRELTDDRVKPVLTGGHSLGEYCAWSRLGRSISKPRCGWCKNAVSAWALTALAKCWRFRCISTTSNRWRKNYCVVSARNLPDQTVIGGLGEDLDRLTEEAHAHFPRKRPTRLKTEGAFHTFYMITAALHFRPVLDAATMSTPTVRALSNCTGAYHDPDPAAIKTRLFFQLFHPVNWIDNLEIAFRDGINTIIEFGGGLGSGAAPEDKRPNLESMIKKALRGSDFTAHYHAAINSQTLRETAEALRS